MGENEIAVAASISHLQSCQFSALAPLRNPAMADHIPAKQGTMHTLIGISINRLASRSSPRPIDRNVLIESLPPEDSLGQHWRQPHLWQRPAAISAMGWSACLETGLEADIQLHFPA